MSDPAGQIIRITRSVSMRTRILSLQDNLILALIIGGLVGAVLLLLISFRPIELNRSVILVGVAIVSAGVALIRWEFERRAGNPDPVFLIDSTFELDDRVAASASIIERGGPRRPLEEALIQDTADRLRDKKPETVVPFRIRRWYALSLVSVVLFVAALMIPARPLPTSEALASERTDIEAAGENLERAAKEIEQTLPPGNETTALAKEQGEIGRGFRGIKLTRAEALRKLSALEERIRKRHDLLAETRADEIVSLADRRLRSTLSDISTERGKSNKGNPSQASESFEAPNTTAKEVPKNRGASLSSSNVQSKPTESKSITQPDDVKSATSRESRVANSNIAPGSKQSQSNELSRSGASNRENGQSNSSSVVSKEQNADSTKGNAQRDTSAQESSIQKSIKDSSDKIQTADQKPNAQQGNESNKSSSNPLNSLPTSLAEQVAKHLPDLSSELLKKASELRANELTKADVEKLRKAAESLSKDLAQIGQSQELKKALEELARQVKPEQIEQAARELANQEETKKELEAAARLLGENQQAKETVAGIAAHIAKRGENEQRRAQLAGDLDKQNRTEATSHSSGNQTAGGTRNGQSDVNTDGRLAGQGRETMLRGKVQQHSGGEYLYLQSRAGTGAARAPYSSAYPQYRREAERSVQRSQVPSNLRTVVRKYFDAINPDGKK